MTTCFDLGPDDRGARLGRFLPGVLCLVTLTIGWPALAEPCPEDDGRVARVDVTLDQAAGEVQVDPASVTVYLDPAEYGESTGVVHEILAGYRQPLSTNARSC